jgi:hypothetical protein
MKTSEEIRKTPFCIFSQRIKYIIDWGVGWGDVDVLYLCVLLGHKCFLRHFYIFVVKNSIKTDVVDCVRRLISQGGVFSLCLQIIFYRGPIIFEGRGCTIPGGGGVLKKSRGREKG